MPNAINACIIGHLLALIAIFLNWDVGIDIGIMAGVLAFAAAYVGDQLTCYLSQFVYYQVTTMTKIQHGTALLCYALSIIFVIISYAIWLTR